MRPSTSLNVLHQFAFPGWRDKIRQVGQAANPGQGLLGNLLTLSAILTSHLFAEFAMPEGAGEETFVQFKAFLFGYGVAFKNSLASVRRMAAIVDHRAAGLTRGRLANALPGRFVFGWRR
jgi:hypothetical protein